MKKTKSKKLINRKNKNKRYGKATTHKGRRILDMRKGEFYETTKGIIFLKSRSSSEIGYLILKNL
jgi:hypothetical protein